MALIFLLILGVYAAVGLLFGCWFVIKGVGKIDANANNASWFLRLMWLPGALALWPILLRKIAQTPPPHDA